MASPDSAGRIGRSRRVIRHQKGAEEWAVAEEEARLRRQRKTTAKGAGKMTVATLITGYLEDDPTKALRSYNDTKRRLAFFGDDTTLLRDFGAAHVRAARDSLKVGKRTAATVNRYLSCLRSAWSYAQHHDYVDRAWPKGHMLPEPDGRTRFLTDEEIARLLKAAEGDATLDAAIRVALASGMREGEILALNWADVDLAKGTATILRSKTGHKRMVSLGDAGVAALKRLRGDKVTALSGAIFLTPTGARLDLFALGKRWRPIRKAAKLEDFRFHDCRHTCASIMAQYGATLLEIGTQLGHRSLQTTLRYAHLVQGAAPTGQKELSGLLK